MKNYPSMNLFWLYIRISIMLIVLSGILAAIMISIDLNSLIVINDLFHIF